ncbi:cellulose-binding protein [Nocardioides aestuarii]|uniref:Cellulose-binding protein n=1 Tax=Nocardioides aestuarii TaxID=252231 RepID=A0ABW4TR25_9ACTN
MSDTTSTGGSEPSFRIVRRGYEPTDVNRHVADLLKEQGNQQQRIAELSAKVRELEASRTLQAEQAPEPATFADLGKRVGDILTLAEDEAAEIRGNARADADALLAEATSTAERQRTDAQEYAAARRAEADEEAERLVAGAHRRADELGDEAEREASARRAEADAVYEAQQAEAARAAADFETTLAARRDAAEGEFAAQFETAKSQLVEAQSHLDRTRGDAQRIRTEAETGARRLVEDAQKEAEGIIAAARTHADRIREESDRELVAATQRRDSINAQLGNVRQMLATLTGGAAAGLLTDKPEDAVGASTEEPAQEPEVDDAELEVDDAELQVAEAEAEEPAEAVDEADDDEKA